MPKDTSIGIDNELWKRLNSRKGPGDSFEDVISDALDELEELQEESDDDLPDRDRADHGGGPTDEFDPDADVDELLQEESADVDQEAIDDVDTPADSPSRESFEEAAEAIIDHTKQRGKTSRSVAQEALHANYDAGYQNKRTWWRKVAKPVLDSHAKVNAPVEGASTWRYQD